MSNGKLIDRAFLLFLTYVLLLVVTVSASDPEYTFPRSFLSVYFVAGMLLAFLLAGVAILRKRAEYVPLTQPKILLGLTAVLALVFCVSRFILLRYNMIWQDELTQYLGSISKANAPGSIKHLIEFSIDQQQPPLDYYLTHGSYLLFGYGLFSLKFHPLLFSGLATLFLFWIMDEWTGKRWLSWAAVLMFGAMPFIMKNSMEARPLSLGVLTSLFALYYTFRFWRGTSNRWDGALLLSAGLVFVMAIGLQPEIFLIVLFLSLLALGLSRGSSKRTWEVLLVYQLVAVYFVPYLYEIYTEGKKYSQFHPLTSDWILQNLKKAPTMPGLSFFQEWLDPNRYWGYFLLGVIALALVFVRKEKRETVRNQFLALVVFACVFPTFFNFIFNTFIDWANLPHYRIVYASAFMILAVLASAILVELGAQVHRAVGRTFQALFIVFFLAMTVFDYSQGAIYLRTVDSWKVDLASIYTYLKKWMAEEDHYLAFNFARLGDFPHPAFIGGRVYLDPQQLEQRIDQRVGEAGVSTGMALVKVPGKIWILVDETKNDPRIINFFIDGFRPFGKVKRFHNASIIEVGEDVRPRLIELMHRTLMEFPGNGDLFTFYETLYSYYSFKGDGASASAILNEMAKTTVNRTVSITGHDFDPQAVLRRRMSSLTKDVRRQLQEKSTDR